MWVELGLGKLVGEQAGEREGRWAEALGPSVSTLA